MSIKTLGFSPVGALVGWTTVYNNNNLSILEALITYHNERRSADWISSRAASNHPVRICMHVFYCTDGLHVENEKKLCT